MTSLSRAGKANSDSMLPQDGLSNAIPAGEARLGKTAGVAARTLLGSDVRTEKVAALRQSISVGRYNVASSDVADKVIDALLQQNGWSGGATPCTSILERRLLRENRLAGRPA